MQSSILNTNPLELSLEQFDALEVPTHEFSANYHQRKAALLRSLEGANPTKSEQARAKRWHLPRAAAAALVAACVALPVGAYAVVNHAGFFDGAFGTAWRQSKPAIESTQDQGGEKAPVRVVYPASEVKPVDQEVAQALLGDAVYNEPLSVTAPDGHVLTIDSVVRSEYALVYSFTLHRDGGVTALEWSEQTNNVAAKGAYMPYGQQFSWAVAGDEFVYVDPNASTPDTVVGYAYTVFGSAVPEGQPVALTVYTCDVPFNTDIEENQFHMERYEIPCTTAVASTQFESAEGSSVVVSPLGLYLSERALFAAPQEADGYDMAYDPINVRSITLNMDSGETYTVFDQASTLDNRLSACGFETNLSVAFNRLVDPAHVASVEVGITDATNMDDLADAYGGWPTDAEWPTKKVVYQRT